MAGQKNKSPYMMAIREKILDTAMREFAAKGIRAVRMDDIAQLLGISKRTLYEIYDNKEKLLFEGIKKYKASKYEAFLKLNSESKNVMEMMLQIYRKKVEEFHETSPSFFAEIGKYPSVVKYLNEDRQLSHERFISFLSRGVDEGYFRNDVNLELVSFMFNSIGDYVMTHELYKNYTIEQLFNNLVLVSLRGLCTTEGVKLLDQYFPEESL